MKRKKDRETTEIAPIAPAPSHETPPPAGNSFALTEPEAAHFLGLKSGRTLYNWRREGTGPVHMDYGKAIRYHKADLEAWMQSRRKVGPNNAPRQAAR